MLIKNTLKIVLNNLNVVFKSMIFRLVLWIIGFVSLYFLGTAILDGVVKSDELNALIGALKEIWQNFMHGEYLKNVDLKQTFESFTNLLKVEFISNIGLFICALIIGYVLLVLNGICTYTVSSMIHAKMSTMTKLGFFEALFMGLKKSIVFEAIYALLKVIAILVSVLLGVLVAVYTYDVLFIFAIALGFAISVILFTLFLVVTALFRPSVVAGEPIKNLFINKLIHKHFGVILCSFFVGVIISWYINVSMFITTLGVGLILSVPLTQIFFAVMQHVLKCHLDGIKYFIDFETIETPNKLKKEVKAANFLDEIEV